MNTLLTYRIDGKEHKVVCDKTLRLRPIAGTNRAIIDYYNMHGVEIEVIDIERF